jgi:hypothetical protein
MYDFKVKLRPAFHNMTYEVFVYYEKDRQRIMLLNPDGKTFTEYDTGACLNPTPTYVLPYDMLKSLRDELDTFGIRGASDEKIAGKLEATQAHLEDMRKLVFGGKK